MPEPDQTLVRTADLLALLSGWYRTLDKPLPTVECVDPSGMPPRDRRLLVHETDMTSTLERHHVQAISVRTLHKTFDGDVLQRTVCLVGVEDGKPVEFGAIRIHLRAFEPDSRAEIEQCRKPLGAILRDHGMAHQCRPGAYFRVKADQAISDALGINGPDAQVVLYGRHNELSGPGSTRLAEVVEILPPA
jgi:hypothetical protein